MICGESLSEEKELLKGSIESYYARVATYYRVKNKQHEQEGNTRH